MINVDKDKAQNFTIDFIIKAHQNRLLYLLRIEKNSKNIKLLYSAFFLLLIYILFSITIFYANKSHVGIRINKKQNNWSVTTHLEWSTLMVFNLSFHF